MIQELEMDPLLVTPKRCALSRKWKLCSSCTWRDPTGWKGSFLIDCTMLGRNGCCCCCWGFCFCF